MVDIGYFIVDVVRYFLYIADTLGHYLPDTTVSLYCIGASRKNCDFAIMKAFLGMQFFF